MSSSQTCRLALKEWAVTQRALDRGEQILLLRKGGIREEEKEFRVRHTEFLIYPTYEHQRPELLKPAWQEALQAVLAKPHDPQRIDFTHWARVAEVIELTEHEKLEAISPYYIWTPAYAEARLHWKPAKPLLVMLVHVYRLEAPQSVPFLPEYAGCKSWVTLDRDITLGALQPVLPDEEFLRRAQAIRAAVA